MDFDLVGRRAGGDALDEGLRPAASLSEATAAEWFGWALVTVGNCSRVLSEGTAGLGRPGWTR